MFDLDTQHGVKGLLLSFIGLALAYVMKDVVKGIYAFLNRNKRPTREEFQHLIKALNANSQLLNQQKLIGEKLALDVRRIYLFLKVIAGTKWPEYRKQVNEIEDELKESGL